MAYLLQPPRAAPLLAAVPLLVANRVPPLLDGWDLSQRSVIGGLTAQINCFDTNGFCSGKGCPACGARTAVRAG